MNNNATVIVALITAIAAIISPAITAWFNTRTQLKLKALDMFYLEKMKSYKEFCANSSSHISEGANYSSRYFDKYTKAYEDAYLLSSPKIQSKMDKLKKYLDSKLGASLIVKDREYASTLLYEIRTSMSNELKSYK